MDVSAKDVTRHGLVPAEERCAGKTNEQPSLQPALHLAVHVAALRPVAFVDEHVEAPRNWRWIALEVGHVELVDQRAQEARCRRSELFDELRPRSDARGDRIRADDPGVLHHLFDLLVQFVAVGDDEDASGGILLKNPLGEQHHHDAFPAALGVPDDAAFALRDACLGGLRSEELVRPRHLLVACVEDDEVPDQVE